MNLFFCGDIMPGGVLPYQSSYISQELQGYMEQFDYRIGTLESAIGTNLPYDDVKMQGRANIIYARNEDFFRIKDMGFDVVSLANNHVWDLGEEGLKNTIEILKANGIKYCGAGMDIEEASKPAIIEKDGIRIAILAYCMYGSKYLGYVELAGDGKAGINPLDIDKVVDDIKNAKKMFDKVIVLPHWGREYRYDPLPNCVTMAKRMIDSGADAVLGSHTHQMQPFLKYKGKPICFSMGNFLFPDFYMYPPRPIWYPASKESVVGIEDVVGYPFPINKPIRQVWNPISRYGCAITLNYTKRGYTSKVEYVHTSDDNVVMRAELPQKIRKKLRLNRYLIQYKALRVVKKIKNKFL